MSIFEFLLQLDAQILLLINGMHSTYFDWFMSMYSSKWVWVPMYAAIFFVMVRNFDWKVTVICTISLAMVIVFADQVCATLIRPLVERMRPSNPNNPLSEKVHIVNNHRGGRYGFPSCHSANTFALAFFVSMLYRRRWLTTFSWAGHCLHVIRAFISEYIIQATCLPVVPWALLEPFLSTTYS